MTVGFNEIPSNLRTPFVIAEFDNSRANQGPALLNYRGLVMGQRLSTGTAAANVPVLVSGADDGVIKAGRGSQLAAMGREWFRNNPVTETWFLPVDDNGAATAAAGSIAWTGPATEGGVVPLYVGGRYIPFEVAAGDADTAIAGKATAAITADLDAEVTAATDTAATDLTARNEGAAGNGIDIRIGYQQGDKVPAGVGYTITAMTGGATNPVLTTAITNMGDQWFNIIAHPWTDATSLTAIEAELSSRFGPLRMIDGVAFTSAPGSLGTLTALGNTRNSQHSVIAAQPGASPITTPWAFAAQFAAVVARYGSIDPARPFQTLPLTGALPPATVNLFTNMNRNTLLFNGIATSKAVDGGVVQVDRPITTYRTNAAGGVDPSYLDVTTMLTLMYLRFSFRQRMLQKYPRHKLASDGARVAPGQPIITPSAGKAEALSWFRDMENLGLVENFALFKANLVVERNALDVNRLDFLLPPDIMNQLIVTAAKIEFRL